MTAAVCALAWLTKSIVIVLLIAVWLLVKDEADE